MEQPLVQSNSVHFEPVDTTTKPRTKKNISQTLTLDSPAKIHRNSHWNCYQKSVASESLLANHRNFNTSESPARLMQWSGGAWAELASDALLEVKSAFEERRPMIEVKIDGNDYMFDFFRMLQIDVRSGLQRSISWIDVRGDCFFPKFFVDESLVDEDDDDDDHEGVDVDEVPKIEIEIKIGSDDVSRCSNKRKDREEEKLEDTADSSCNNGRLGDDDDAKRRRVNPVGLGLPNAKLLSEGESSYTVVRNLFMNGMKTVDPNVSISSIHQFDKSGRIEKARWQVFQTYMQTMEAVRGRSNTVFAWCGATRKEVVDILGHGFGKVPNRGGYGVGVYFSHAHLPQISDMLSEDVDNGEKYLVLCRVILGKQEKIEVGSQQCEPSSEAFDSGVDDLANPKLYIVWSRNMNFHVLPECIVSYKSSGRNSGDAMGVDFLKWVPMGSSSVVAKLFSKLGSSLPAPKVEELKALCMTFKAGKMAKDVFIRQLKFVVGNEMLKSAISEVQGSN